MYPNTGQNIASTVFYNIQGLEIVNPMAAEKKVQEV